MPLSDEVRNLLEFSIELLVIGGGLPSLFLQRPAWLRELRQRYSLWRGIRGRNHIINALLLIVLPILTAVVLFHLCLAAGWYPWDEHVFYGSLIIALFLVAVLWHLDTLSVVPPILGAVVLFHLCIAAGWCPWDETIARTVFYGSLVVAFFFVAVLWYQVRMTTFTQATLRIFWLAWYMFRKSDRQAFTIFLSKSVNHDEDAADLLRSKAHARPNIPGGWNQWVAWIQTHLVPRKPAEWRTKVIRDLGRLGANTRTPQETVFVLKALGNLAYVVPVDTSGKEGALTQLTEATSRTLWPLEASDQEAFERAIRVFENILERWTNEKAKLRTEDDERSGIMAESPLMPHLYRLGREILNHFPILTKRYLKMFTPHDDVRDNNSEAHLLFLLGLQAITNEQWEPLLYILEKLREYATCPLGQHVAQKPRCIDSVPHGGPADDALQWLAACEPTLWFLGLVAYLHQHTPASWPWLRNYLLRLWPWDEDPETRQELRCTLWQARRFFTTVVFQPETAHAVACLYQRLFPDEPPSPEPEWQPDCRTSAGAEAPNPPSATT